MSGGYPARVRFDAHRLTRLLFKSCAAQSIGHHAMLLVIHIAHTEDAARYQGPVRFWNSQLSETLGFKSPKQLNTCRDIAVRSGWLHYEREHDRAVGYYWTEVPKNVSAYDDRPIEGDISYSDNGTGFHSADGTGSGMGSGTGSGKPSYPGPNPIPKERARNGKAKKAANATDAEFAAFWDAYPSRDGRKLERANAVEQWNRLSDAERETVMRSVVVYANSGQRPKDAFRWLRDKLFNEWTPETEVSSPDPKPQIIEPCR